MGCGTPTPLYSVGPEIEPNLWMWVNPNVVYPPGKLEAQRVNEKEDVADSNPCTEESCNEEDAHCPEAIGVDALSPSSTEQSPSQKHFTSSSPSSWEV